MGKQRVEQLLSKKSLSLKRSQRKRRSKMMTTAPIEQELKERKRKLKPQRELSKKPKKMKKGKEEIKRSEQWKRSRNKSIRKKMKGSKDKSRKIIQRETTEVSPLRFWVQQKYRKRKRMSRKKSQVLIRDKL
jgi:hypothetical protein